MRTMTTRIASRRRMTALARVAASSATVFLIAVSLPTADAETVLTGNQATFSLTSALAANTTITVVNVPEDGREISILADYIGRRMDRLAPTFAGATAAVSLTNALPGDPLYRFAREANIRIVNIDAAIPFSVTMPGVALIDAPVSNVAWGSDADTPTSATSPYFWLAISNAIRMADIIAHDLSAIFPTAAPAIAENLDDLKWSLLNLRSDYEDRLIAAGDDTVFALTGDFVYLTNDLGLFVDGYFIKQDVRWTEEDFASLTRHLDDRDIRVVVHKWMPSEAIQSAIAAAGAELVVLQTGDPGIVVGDSLAIDGLQQILRANLEALTAALAR
jgi:ABC-type Zn uptake system ZnuABC Zn-binding protein ZnuA